MSHVLSIFKKSKFCMLIMIFLRFFCEETYWPSVGITLGYAAMMACTQKLEKSNISNNRFVLLMAHFITFIKVLTSISATIRKNEEFPRGLSIGVVISLILTMESMKTIEPDYRKSIKFFMFYWSIYLGSLCMYYQTIIIEEVVTFIALFYLVFEIYKENYYLSDSLTEIFYDFHNDPVIIFDDFMNIKCNKNFLMCFGNLVSCEKIRHHSQMLTKILNPQKRIFELKKDGVVKLSLLDIFTKYKNSMNQKEVIVRDKGKEKIFMLTIYKLENLYHSKVICTLKDTTNIHQLNQAKSQVEFRSVIMGCLTHELRTPVNCAVSILDTLQDYLHDSREARKLMSICKSTIELLRSLTEDFIDFTRFENNKGLPIQKEAVDLSKFFDDIENIFVFQAEEKGITFEINMDKSLPSTIRTDPKRLKQIILNLLSNSFKFTQKGKIAINLYCKKVNVDQERLRLGGNDNHDMTQTIIGLKSPPVTIQEVSMPTLKGLLMTKTSMSKFRPSSNQKNSENENDLSEESFLYKFLHIEVTDTGCGMDKKNLSELFTKFKTGNKQGMNANGLGLGLYLSKEISEKLGGDISCDSIRGKGSTFTIRLPFDSLKEVKSILNKFQPSKFIHKSESPHSIKIEEAFSEFTAINTPLDGFDQQYSSKPLKKISSFYEEEKSCYSFNKGNRKRGGSLLGSSKSSKIDSFFTEQPQTKIQPRKKCDCKILVVDDVPFNILSIEMLIKNKFNLEIEKAFSGEEAIAAVKNKLSNPCCQVFPLIIMDYYMPPGINGADTAAKIREILGDKKCKIVLLTAQREGDFDYNKSNQYFDGFFSKPIKIEEIEGLINEV
ncbi:unnamed protein product [Moneuplotes crassus]|uniref:histidine kinase n=1 Tax=Euplotes crassus TaxID=5936 RepID=A0AAD1Y375_EUPCR|nr:unnamed protein product [Moneuplotes crassus]